MSIYITKNLRAFFYFLNDKFTSTKLFYTSYHQIFTRQSSLLANIKYRFSLTRENINLNSYQLYKFIENQKTLTVIFDKDTALEIFNLHLKFTEINQLNCIILGKISKKLTDQFIRWLETRIHIIRLNLSLQVTGNNYLSSALCRLKTGNLTTFMTVCCQDKYLTIDPFRNLIQTCNENDSRKYCPLCLGRPFKNEKAAWKVCPALYIDSQNNYKEAPILFMKYLRSSYEGSLSGVTGLHSFPFQSNRHYFFI